MKKIILAALLMACACGFAAPRPVVIYMIGDSTMADKDTTGRKPERGWGQMFPEFTDSSLVKIDNRALNGRSSKSFRGEGHWDYVMKNIRPGDYVFIQFGHNDQKSDTARYSAPGSSYNENLKRYIAETRSKGGIPVLFTSIVRRNFDESGQLVDTHGDYIRAVIDVGRETGVPVIDMNASTARLLRSMPIEETKKLFMWVPAGVVPGLMQGAQDNTHLNVYGARVVASLAAEEIAQKIPELAPAMKIKAQTPVVIKVWPSGVPNSNGITTPEIAGEGGRVENVSDPEMYVYRAVGPRSSGAAILICPGGGYVRLAMQHEGHEVAQWLAQNGVTAVVLKYRMPNGHSDVPLSDAVEAMKIIRRHAPEWGIDPEKVGVAGFSAGGHLAATLATRFDAGSRPDFAVLFYPVITLDFSAHAGSKSSLLGANPSEKLIDQYSVEKWITPQTPTMLIFHSDDDKGVSVSNSLAVYSGLKSKGVPAAMYIFPTGGHGWGFRSDFEYHEQWKVLMLKWLRYSKVIE